MPSRSYLIRALRNELQELDPYPWEPVERWATRARPVLQEHTDIAEFDKKAHPSFPLGIVGSHTDLAEKAAKDRELYGKIAGVAKEQLVALLDGIILTLGSTSHLSINESARLALGALNHERERRGGEKFRVKPTSKTLSGATLSPEEASRGLRGLLDKKLVDEGEKGVFALSQAGVEAWEHLDRLEAVLPLGGEEKVNDAEKPVSRPAAPPVRGGTADESPPDEKPRVETQDPFEYDVALSFAGEDREYADDLARILSEQGVRVFYDAYEKATLWGKDLYVHLHDIYSKRARFCVIFVSKHHAEKVWTSRERQAAQERALDEKGREYILPIRIDDAELPGLEKTIGYVSITEGIATISELLLEKLKMTPARPPHASPTPHPTRPSSPFPPPLPPPAFLLLSFLTGTGGVATVVTFAWTTPNPSLFQWWVFVTVLALGGAGFVTFITGFLSLKFRLGGHGALRPTTLSATGGAGVFLLLLLLAPTIGKGIGVHAPPSCPSHSHQSEDGKCVPDSECKAVTTGGPESLVQVMRYVEGATLVQHNYVEAEACSQAVLALNHDGRAYEVFPYLALADDQTGHPDTALARLNELGQRLRPPPLPPFDDKSQVNQLANALGTCSLQAASVAVRMKMVELRDLAREQTVPPAPVAPSATPAGSVTLPIKEEL